MKYIIFTNLRTNQLPFINTKNTALVLLKKPLFSAVVSIKANGDEKLKKLTC